PSKARAAGSILLESPADDGNRCRGVLIQQPPGPQSCSPQFRAPVVAGDHPRRAVSLRSRRLLDLGAAVRKRMQQAGSGRRESIATGIDDALRNRSRLAALDCAYE